MECNRDEAVRAKQIAERKFFENDIRGAKKFALKAQNLYPELDGISQMVMTFEVYYRAEERTIQGESNWYGVLGVAPVADEGTIRKKFRKLALMLHPDKNRSVGAEGAFQLISQAWYLLSDKSKRVLYDRRHSSMFQKKANNENPNPSQPMQNGFYHFAKNVAHTRPPKVSSKRTPSSGSYPPLKKDHNTFWTVCNRCKMQYEYLRSYVNQNLLCPNCHEAYLAVEIDPPSIKGTKVSSQTINPQKHGSNATRNNSASQHGVSGSSHFNANQNKFEWVPFSKSNGTQSAFQAVNNMVQQAYEKVKQERQKEQAARKREEALRRKNLGLKRTIKVELHGNSSVPKKRKEAEDDRLNDETTNGGSLRRCTSNQGPVDCKQLLMEKARGAIFNKLNGTTVRSAAYEDPIQSTIGNEGVNLKEECVAQICRQHKIHQSDEMYLRAPTPSLDKQMFSVNVLDPDFHNFDNNRTEKCFEDNQVWAVYDDDDGMPRNYVVIHNVISQNPFKVSMSRLIPTMHGRQAHVSWFSNGFSKTCGEFRIGKQEFFESVEPFSHIVRPMKHCSKTFRIFPQKGEIWALYRNWCREWNELTEDEVIHKYDMVEVLEDYDEDLGVIVIPLVKVAGFKAVFHQHLNPMEIKRIRNEEMPRFSHQVPSHLLSGQEAPRSPRGCYELDPAATPREILESIQNVEQIEFMENDKEITITNRSKEFLEPNTSVSVTVESQASEIES